MKEKDQVQEGVVLAQAIMWTCAEDEPVLALVFCISANPSIWIPSVRIGIGLWIMERKPSRRNDHGAFGCRVVLLCDIEVLLDDVRYH